jgi:hypothetical protein
MKTLIATAVVAAMLAITPAANAATVQTRHKTVGMSFGDLTLLPGFDGFYCLTQTRTVRSDGTKTPWHTVSIAQGAC